MVQLARESWFKWELGGSSIGSLIIQWPGKWHQAGPRKELARGQLTLPAGTAISKSGRIYVSSPIFGPGAVYQAW